jgi:maltooligosyltrehalose trehalohydrolase
MRDIGFALAGDPSAAPGDRCVACIQNHDQVGNRALGERLGHLVGPGPLRLAAALLLTAPLVPLLFQGEEWNASAPFQYFTDHQDPALAEAVRAGRRAEHAAFVGDPDRVPDPQDPATHRRSVLDRGERDRAGHREVLDWYTRLIALRRGRADLLDGRRDRVRVRTDERARTIEVRRGSVIVIGNAGDAAARFEVPPVEPVLAFPEPPRDGVVAPGGVAVFAVRAA